MTSLGQRRGRGWGSVVDGENRPALRRPGTAAVSERPKYNTTIDDINNLSIGDSVPTQKIREIIEDFQNVASEGNLVDLADRLHEQALADREFGIKYAVLFSHQQFLAIKGNDIDMRTLLLNAMQSDFQKKEEIKKSSMTQFRNAVSLLGETYYHATLSCGARLKILELPLIEYLNMLLESGTEEDIKLIVTQIARNGRKIYENNDAKLAATLHYDNSQTVFQSLEQFIMNVRKVLVSKDLSSASKGMLLFVIDSANQHYNPLPGDLQEFYITQCGCKPCISTQHHSKTLTVVTNTAGNDSNLDKESSNKQAHWPKDDSNTKNNTVGILMRAPKEKGDTETETITQRTGKMAIGTPNSAGGTTIPRAIRGSGAGDGRQEHKSHSVRHSSNFYKSKSNSFKEAWGHDDRFDCDYE